MGLSLRRCYSPSTDYGEGRNGKSTFWNTLSRVLGTYSGNMSADTLTVGCKRNVKPELAEAKGKRIIIAAELEEGMRLNTSNVKQLCSTDEIYAEKKYKDPFSFVPSHTLVLYTNHLPKVGAIDAGTWRRLIVIPFNAKIEGSSDIKNYLCFLSWEKIAVEMHYSIQHIYRMHDTALSCVAAIMRVHQFSGDQKREYDHPDRYRACMDEGYGKPLGHPVISTENHAAQLDGLDEVLHGHLCRFLLQRLNADRQHLKQDCYGADHGGKFWPSVGWIHLSIRMDSADDASSASVSPRVSSSSSPPIGVSMETFLPAA